MLCFVLSFLYVMAKQAVDVLDPCNSRENLPSFKKSAQFIHKYHTQVHPITQAGKALPRANLLLKAGYSELYLAGL